LNSAWRRLLLTAASAAAAVALAACGTQSGAGNPDSQLTPEQASAPIEGASPQLAAIRAQAGELLPGGEGAFNDRIAKLRGTPIVVNNWASWCGPCRFEFPYFQSQGEKRGGEIAFLGVGSDDSQDALATFLDELPLPYPTYLDPHKDIWHELDVTVGLPATAFYDSSGERVFTHQGTYADEDALAADIDRYAK
jgi:cytochrome c biogenesis protein CcmG, thiol:disulfide interchange protein DsbE